MQTEHQAYAAGPVGPRGADTTRSNVSRGSIRSYLITLVLGVAVPLLLFALVQAASSAQQQRELVENTIVDRSRGVAVAVNNELEASIRALRALADSRELDHGYLSGFSEGVHRVLAQQPWYAVWLAAPDGTHLLNSLRPLGTDLPSLAKWGYVQRTVETGRPTISGLIQGRLTRGYHIAVSVPVIRQGTVRYVLTAGLKPDILSQLLASHQDATGNGIGSIIDSDYTIIARSVGAEKWVGRSASEQYISATRDRMNGVSKTTTVDGKVVYVAFTRVPNTGWMVGVSVPASEFEAPLQKALLTTAVSGILLLLASVAAAVFAGRRIARPIGKLAAAAGEMAQARPVDVTDHSVVAEIATLAGALGKASHAMNRLVVAERELTRSEQRIRACFDHAALGIVEMDGHERFVAVNERICSIFGYTREQLAARDVYALTAPEDREQVRDDMRKLRSGELEDVDCERRYLRVDGSVVWVHTTISAIREPDGATDHCIATIEDISERKRAEHALSESEEQFQQLARHIPEAFWITDVTRHSMIYVSPAFERIHGARLQSMRGVWRTWKDTLHPDDRERVLAAHRDMALGPIDVQYRIVRPDGATRWVHARGYPVEDASGAVYRVAGTIEDITDRRELEEKLQYQAHFDSLTGLPNRVLFFDRLGQAVSHAQRSSHRVGVLFVDIDRFKIVNDTLGHGAGDALLQHVARSLTRAVRAEDTVARLGGDEFAIILPHVERPEHAATVAQKALAFLAEPLQLERQEVIVTGSIGVAISSSDGFDAETLVKNADAAMFRAKNSGRNGYEFYTAEMNDRAIEQLEMEGRLRRALERDEFVLHFQPKSSVSTGRLTGWEALLRWRSSDGALVPPARFVHLLEETGLIMPVGEWVVNAACKLLADRQRQGLPVHPIAVNVSAKQFNQRNLAKVIERALERHCVDGRLLEIELTESAAMQNPEETIVTLCKLKGLGVRIGIDDFGTGYSSLSYLKRLPLDVLKIDRSFITGLPGNDNDASITRAIITMAHSLGLKVVAEGVEEIRQVSFLAQNGCDEMQGYLLSPPVPSDEMGEVAQRHLLAAGDGYRIPAAPSRAIH